MPFPSDPALLEVSKELLETIDKVFGGVHDGFRPLHARGVVVKGTFTPSAAAASLSTAPHFNQASTPITTRFSSSTGIPDIPDTNPQSNPRGFAIRFDLAPHVHTDIVSHSANGFPCKTGAEFRDFFNALASGTIEQFLGTHPAALAFVQLPKPFPTSFATEQFFGVNAFKFTNSQGVSRFGRYIITPDQGISHLTDEEAKSKDAGYLYDAVPSLLPITYTLKVQLANDGDVTNDATVAWPADREIVELGKIKLEAVDAESATSEKKIIFDPVPRVEGIEGSDDPLIDFRAAMYLLTGRRRREAAGITRHH